jgi:MFS family permease
MTEREGGVTYISEFRLNWQTLVATFIGIATGFTLNHYTMSLFAPELIKEFGWSKAQFALLRLVASGFVLVVPFAGRFTDRFGTRIAAVIGFIAMSLGFFAFSLMNGNILEFFAIYLFQNIVGVLTTSLVFTRAIVECFDKARGTALSALMMGAPASGVVAAPLLGFVIAQDGWRTGFVVLAIASAIGGFICVTLMGRNKRAAPVDPTAERSRLSRADLLALVRHPTFLLIVGGMFLINIPQAFAASQ